MNEVIESRGACLKASRCGHWDVVLGNGLCVECWDKAEKPYRKGEKISAKRREAYQREASRACEKERINNS